MRKVLTTAGLIAGVVPTSLVGCSVGKAQAEGDMPNDYKVRVVPLPDGFEVLCVEAKGYGYSVNYAIDCNWMGAKPR